MRDDGGLGCLLTIIILLLAIIAFGFWSLVSGALWIAGGIAVLALIVFAVVALGMMAKDTGIMLGSVLRCLGRLPRATGRFLAKELRLPRFQKREPPPGDPDFLDWANRRGEYRDPSVPRPGGKRPQRREPHL